MTLRSRWFVLTGTVAIALVGSACEPSLTSKWVSGGAAPVLADVNGDGVLDILGAPEQGELAAFDGNTFRRLWTTKVPAGPIAATKDHFVVGARARNLVTFDLKTGAQTTTLPLSDEVSSVCADGDFVWVRQLDQVDLRLDPRSGTPARGLTPPAKCKPLQSKTRPCESALASCDLDQREGRAGGTFAADLALVDGADRVSVTFKRPGTPEVTIVGNDAGGAVTWKTPIDPTGQQVDAVDLAGGVLFVKQLGNVTAVDARSGAVLWKASVGNSSTSVLRAAPTRLYVGCDGPRSSKALRVVDTRSGKILATFGKMR